MTISQIFHTIGQVYTQSFPPKATFSAEQVPDLTGRVCIVTGKLLRSLDSSSSELTVIIHRWICWYRKRNC